jgi:hypothetical protein
MKLSVPDTYRAKAEHCSQQSRLTNDTRLKKYWEQMAAEWLVLGNVQMSSTANGHAGTPQNVKERAHE